MRKSTSFFVLLGILSVAVPLYSSAQPRSAISIGGLSAEQAEGQFGKPDDKSSSGGNLETWHYADSEIIFESGKVMLWNDPSGELEKRRMLSRFQLKSPEPAPGPSGGKGWVNDWTPPQRPDSDALIEKLLEE